jgi:hypothetical protein
MSPCSTPALAFQLLFAFFLGVVSSFQPLLDFFQSMQINNKYAMDLFYLLRS